jgi:hypothetical protein
MKYPTLLTSRDKKLIGKHGEGHLKFKNAMKLFAKRKDDLDLISDLVVCT